MKTLLIFLFLFGASLQTYGMHIVGGYFQYALVEEVSPGVNRYQCTLTIYRDCAGGGAAFDKPAFLAVFVGTQQAADLYAELCIAGTSSNCNQGTIGVNVIKPAAIACEAVLPGVCLERAVYTFFQDLPVRSDAHYFIVYQRCCRTTGITNIPFSGDFGSTFFIDIPPVAQVSGNASPVLQELPPVYLAVNRPVDYPFRFVDADGDSLAYRFCHPLAGGGPLLNPQAILFSCEGAAPRPPCPPPFDTVPFATPGFTAQAPLGVDMPVTLNAAGRLQGTPSSIGRFAAAVCVDEYRNGQLIATNRLEWQFNVVDCTTVDVVSPGNWQNGFKVTPNPASDRLWITSATEWLSAEPIRFELFNSQGRCVLSQSIAPETDGASMHLPNLPGGMYHWAIRSGFSESRGSVFIDR
ncbi:MAG: hypothetical protein SFV52_11590 [Saprospiraceae bacterium]|nr:hypothetical protein [Saprospiraceae bacterium]